MIVWYHIVPFFPLAFFLHSAESPKNPAPAATRLPKTNIFRAEIGEARVGKRFEQHRKMKKLPNIPNSQTLWEDVRKLE